MRTEDSHRSVCSKSVFLLILSLLLVPLVSAAGNVSCEGEDQLFYVSVARSITIPCVIRSDTALNATCTGMLYYGDNLLGTYPKVKNVDEYGVSSVIVIDSQNTAESFSFTIPQRDLYHLRDFRWLMVCRIGCDTYNSTGNFTSEMPFGEKALKPVQTYFFRDRGILIGSVLFLLIILIMAGVLVKMFR